MSLEEDIPEGVKQSEFADLLFGRVEGYLLRKFTEAGIA